MPQGSGASTENRENHPPSYYPPPVLKCTVEGQRPQILVLKVGTSTLMNQSKNSFSLANLGKFVDAVCELKDRGYHVVIISSGAVGSGCVAMHLKTRPQGMVEKQAISAIGQCRLVRLWEDIFAVREKKTAQLLCTRTDLIDRPRFFNFRNTLLQLLNMDVIPIINENDALATDGLKFGDNDTLGAYVSVAIGANWFFMLTDVDCLFTANPRYHPDAKPIAYVGKIDQIYQLLDADENEGTQWGSGGMRTKIIAAKLCCATGIHVGLCHGASPERIIDIVTFAKTSKPATGSPRITIIDGHKSLRPAQSFPTHPLGKEVIATLKKAAAADQQKESDDAEENPGVTKQTTTPTDTSSGHTSPRGEVISLDSDGSEEQANSTAKMPGYITFESVDRMPYLGTIFAGQFCTQTLRDQRRWILSLPVRGRLYVDDNAMRSIFEKRNNLYGTGIVSVKDVFYPGECVAIYSSKSLETPDRDEDELARCLVNFNSSELRRIAGKKSREFQHILGYYCAHEVAHKSDILFVNPTPVYEKYQVRVTKEMAEMSDDDVDTPELETTPFNPVPVPTEGEVHQLP